MKKCEICKTSNGEILTRNIYELGAVSTISLCEKHDREYFLIGQKRFAERYKTKELKHAPEEEDDEAS